MTREPEYEGELTDILEEGVWCKSSNRNIPFIDDVIAENIKELLVRDHQISEDSVVVLPPSGFYESDFGGKDEFGHALGTFTVYKRNRIIYRGDFYVTFDADVDKTDVCDTVVTLLDLTVWGERVW